MSVPPLQPDDGALEQAAATGLRIGNEHFLPVRPLSAGPDGSAFLARSAVGGVEVELRYATVAQQNPERWQAIDAIQSP